MKCINNLAIFTLLMGISLKASDDLSQYTSSFPLSSVPDLSRAPQQAKGLKDYWKNLRREDHDQYQQQTFDFINFHSRGYSFQPPSATKPSSAPVTPHRQSDYEGVFLVNPQAGSSSVTPSSSLPINSAPATPSSTSIVERETKKRRINPQQATQNTRPSTTIQIFTNYTNNFIVNAPAAPSTNPTSLLEHYKQNRAQQISLSLEQGSWVTYRKKYPLMFDLADDIAHKTYSLSPHHSHAIFLSLAQCLRTLGYPEEIVNCLAKASDARTSLLFRNALLKPHGDESTFLDQVLTRGDALLRHFITTRLSQTRGTIQKENPFLLPCLEEVANDMPIFRCILGVAWEEIKDKTWAPKNLLSTFNTLRKHQLQLTLPDIKNSVIPYVTLLSSAKQREDFLKKYLTQIPELLKEVAALKASFSLDVQDPLYTKISTYVTTLEQRLSNILRQPTRSALTELIKDPHTFAFLLSAYTVSKTYPQTMEVARRWVEYYYQDQSVDSALLITTWWNVCKEMGDTEHHLQLAVKRLREAPFITFDELFSHYVFTTQDEEQVWSALKDSFSAALPTKPQYSSEQAPQVNPPLTISIVPQGQGDVFENSPASAETSAFFEDLFGSFSAPQEDLLGLTTSEQKDI